MCCDEDGESRRKAALITMRMIGWNGLRFEWSSGNHNSPMTHWYGWLFRCNLHINSPGTSVEKAVVWFEEDGQSWRCFPVVITLAPPDTHAHAHTSHHMHTHTPHAHAVPHVNNNIHKITLILNNYTKFTKTSLNKSCSPSVPDFSLVFSLLRRLWSCCWIINGPLERGCGDYSSEREKKKSLFLYCLYT